MYVAEIGARLAKMQEELKELETLRQQLDFSYRPTAISEQDPITCPANSQLGD